MTETLSIADVYNSLPDKDIPKFHAFLRNLRTAFVGVKTTMDSKSIDTSSFNVGATRNALYALKGRLSDYNLPSGVPLTVVSRVEAALQDDQGAKENVRKLYEALIP